MSKQSIWNDKLAEEFTQWYVVINGRSTSAAKKYVVTARKFFDFIADRGTDPAQDEVEAWMRHIYQQCKNKSNATRAVRLSGLRTVCRWMVKKGHLKSDPTQGVPTPRFTPSAAQKFDTSELKALMSAPDPDKAIGLRDKAILMLFYVTGIRREEMSDLTLDRLHLSANGGFVTIRGKGSKHRSVGFGKSIVPLLQKWLIMRAKYAAEGEKHLFISIYAHTKGGAGRKLGVNALHHVIKRAAAAIGMQSESAFLHKLRATYATDLYDNGFNVGEIRTLMGHSSEATTWRYIAISERHLKQTRIPDDRVAMLSGEEEDA